MQDFLNPEEVLNQLKLQAEMTAAEFGSGAGSFSLALAKRIPEGKIYALDIQEEPLSVLASQAKQAGLKNIETIRCDLEEEGGSTLPNDFLDLVLIPNTLFQIDNKKAVLKEAARVLKRGGELLVVDWKEESPLGPKPAEVRVSDKEIKKIAKELKLKTTKDFIAGSFHWGMVFVAKKE